MSTAAETQFEQFIASWLHEHGGYLPPKLGNQALASRDFDPALDD